MNLSRDVSIPYRRQNRARQARAARPGGSRSRHGRV